LAGNGCLPYLWSAFDLMMQEYLQDDFNLQAKEALHDRATLENDQGHGTKLRIILSPWV
jgi:hypothetical protein